MSRPRPTPPRAPAGSHFRSEIDRAEAQGISRADMTLQLTLNDVNKLKRDGSLGVADISFADGEMRYLGVKVVQGGVTTSALSYPATDP